MFGLSISNIALLAAVGTFLLIIGGVRLVQAMRSREALVMRAEDMGASPEVINDPMRRASLLARWADRFDRSARAAKYREQLRLAYIKLRPSEYLALRLGLAVAFYYACSLMLAIAPLASIGIATAAYFLVPMLIFRTRREAYVKAFTEQLVEITQMLANALRAGMSLQQSLGQVADRVAEPAQTEFRQTHRELLLGDSLPQVMGGLCDRVPSRDLAVMANAMVVQHAAGGNIARVLASMSVIQSERQRLISEINAMTSESRISALIIQLMPIGLLVVIRHTPIGEAIFTSWPGWLLLGFYIITQIGIFFLIRRIMRIEV
ncbi:MAG: type II secretion system F family protein [Chloroflexaceae bacterium]|jgi:tight adherence protein B|nr:type II secretion system F family protein [Chloroflexaceae bacterium]